LLDGLWLHRSLDGLPGFLDDRRRQLLLACFQLAAPGFALAHRVGELGNLLVGDARVEAGRWPGLSQILLGGGMR
jgi:hypothetical protein